jgi:hypothetical protein
VNKLSLPALVVGAWLALASPASATDHFWKLVSPDHEQTFAFGTETNHVWRLWGGHLALLLTFTNDPYVSVDYPRRWDNFRFDFPNVRIGSDGRTFYYHTKGGRRIPVAIIRPGFLGEQVRLLPNATDVVSRPSGYITVYLNVIDPDGIALQ